MPLSRLVCLAPLAVLAAAAPARAQDPEADDWESAEDEPQAPLLPRRGFTFRAQMGGAMRQVFSIQARTVQLQLAWGGTRRGDGGRGVVMYGGLGGDIGKTSGGLTTYTVRPGFILEGVSGQLRYGGRVGLVWVGFERASGPGAIVALGMGADLYVSLDVLPLSDAGSSVFISGGLTADFVDGHETVGIAMLGGGLAVGARY